MRRKELKSIVSEYDKDASPEVFVQAIVGYCNHDVIDVYISTGLTLILIMAKILECQYINYIICGIFERVTHF